MASLPSEELLREITIGLRSHEDDPVGWLTAFLAQINEKHAANILADKGEASLVAADAANTPVALVVDCGTSETKVLLLKVVHGAIDVTELAKISAASSYVNVPDTFVNSIHLYLSQVNASVVLVSASAWMRGADEDMLAKGNALLQNLMASGVICKILEPKEEAWFELSAVEYADRTAGFGITATWAAGGGSTQMTRDYKDVHTFTLGNERGRTLIESEGISGVEKWRNEIRGYYRHYPCPRLSGTILGLSAVYYAALASDLPTGTVLPVTRVREKMQQYVDAQSTRANLSPEDIRNLSNVTQQLETMKIAVEDDANLCFVRDLTINGNPFRITWSCGWYLHLLEELKFITVRSKALRQFREEQEALKKLGDPVTREASETSVAPTAAGQVLVDLQHLAQILYRRAENVEKTTTKFLQELAEKTSSSLVGLEFKFKSDVALKEKLELRLRRLLDRHKSKPLYMPRVSDVAHEVDDILRYTVVIPRESYVTVALEFLTALKQQLDCRVNYVSFWQPGSTYFGTNSYITLGDFTFEVQFHTEESWRVKQKDSHELYRAFRILFDGKAKYVIYQCMKDTWGTVPFPPAIETLGPSQPMQSRLMEQIGKIESFKKALANGGQKPGAMNPDTADLCYRLIRGKAAVDFEHLAYPPNEKRLAWVSQSEDLDKILSASWTSPSTMPAVIAHAMGKPLAWVSGKLQDGYVWKLVIMPQELCQKADWDGCLSLVQRYYPEVSGKVGKFRNELSQASFADIERQISPVNSFRAIKNAGALHDQYIDLRKLESLADPTLWQVRGFLFNIIGVNELYRGDGYTYNESGEKSSREFMIRNRKIGEIAGCEVLTITQ